MALNAHRDYNVLMDMRETGTKPEVLDLMAIMAARSRFGPDCVNKIAVIIPKVEERTRYPTPPSPALPAPHTPFPRLGSIITNSFYLTFISHSSLIARSHAVANLSGKRGSNPQPIKHEEKHHGKYTH
jgi:hypothetical protein